MRIFLFLKNSAEFLSAFTSRSSAQYQKASDLPYSARRIERVIQLSTKYEVFHMRKIMLMILSLIAISFLLVSCGTGKAYVALSTWCTDSDGGKDDYFTFGTATIANNKGVIIKTFKDACLPNELRLTEFY